MIERLLHSVAFFILGSWDFFLLPCVSWPPPGGDVIFVVDIVMNDATALQGDKLNEM